MKTKIILMALLILGVSLNTSAQTLTGRDIAQKVKDRPDGDTRYSQINMKLTNKRGSVRERKVESYSIDVGKNDKKSILFFLYPGDVKGTGFLTWEYDDPKKDNDRWLYLPAMKKTRRISGSSAKKDYFMGTDFTYDDMGSRNIDEDTHTLLREENIDGQKCWVLESVSLDKRDIYSKKIAWIRQDCAIAVKVEYYDRADKLHRKLLISNIKQIDGFWTPLKLHMTNVQSEHQTVLEVEDPKFNIKIDASLFTVAQLEKGAL